MAALAIAAVLAIALLVLLHPFRKPAEAIAVERRDLQEIVEESGAVESDQALLLKSEAAGTVAELVATENSEVKAGAPLLRLDATQARLQLEQTRTSAATSLSQAQTQLANARASLAQIRASQPATLAGLRQQLSKAVTTVGFLESELARDEDLLRDGAVTPHEVDNASQQLKQARLDLRIARENLSRAETQPDLVAAKNALSQAETALANAREQGRAALALAEDGLAKTTLRAPFSGTLTHWNVAKGDLVSPGTPLGSFQDLAHLRLRLPVDELDLPKLKLGQAVTIIFDAYPDRPFAGRVGAISRASLEGTSTAGNVQVFPVDVRFDNREGLVKPGMSGDVRVLVRELKGVLAVPLGAVRREHNQFYVMRLVNGKPEQVAITPGVSTLDYLEVRTGLSAGDRILANPTGVR